MLPSLEKCNSLHRGSQNWDSPPLLTPQNSERTWLVIHSATDPTGELLHLLAMSFSMGCLWFRQKWCAWAATYCSSIAFACTTNDDVKQLMSSFMLSLSSMYMSYSQNPGPMVLGGGRWGWDPWNPFWWKGFFWFAMNMTWGPRQLTTRHFARFAMRCLLSKCGSQQLK